MKSSKKPKMQMGGTTPKKVARGAVKYELRKAFRVSPQTQSVPAPAQKRLPVPLQPGYRLKPTKIGVDTSKKPKMQNGGSIGDMIKKGTDIYTKVRSAYEKSQQPRPFDEKLPGQRKPQASFDDLIKKGTQIYDAYKKGQQRRPMDEKLPIFPIKKSKVDTSKKPKLQMGGKPKMQMGGTTPTSDWRKKATPLPKPNRPPAPAGSGVKLYNTLKKLGISPIVGPGYRPKSKYGGSIKTSSKKKK